MPKGVEQLVHINFPAKALSALKLIPPQRLHDLIAIIKYLGQKSKILLEIDPIFIFLLILFISLVSQIGDLIISYFKRKAKLKDTGKILPGHGGFLGRIDGIIFVMPITYLCVLPILINKLSLIK